MSDPPRPVDIEPFLGEQPTSDLEAWRRLWREDLAFPIRSHRPGVVGRLVVAVKRLLRPLVKAPQADLWDRQRTFNLIVLTHLALSRDQLAEALALVDRVGQELQQVQTELGADLRSVQQEFIRDAANLRDRLEFLEAFLRDGLEELTHHHDALFSRVDQKIDRFRREVASARAATPSPPPSSE